VVRQESLQASEPVFDVATLAGMSVNCCLQ
jgi:hypothetical protein